MDISTLSLAQLKELERLVPREIRRRASEERANARRKLEQVAQELGFHLAELLEGGVSRAPRASKGSTVPPKYRHPQQTDLTWSGRGRKPVWVENWLKDGGSIKQLEI
ncbi:MAG: H-NS histone family protein [Zoogloeaceae bacterium]|nr:H-NS histone family protein [Zoogloeaceae bacterium]